MLLTVDNTQSVAQFSNLHESLRFFNSASPWLFIR